MLSACATATPYQPNFSVQPAQAASRGFSEQRIEGKPWKATGSIARPTDSRPGLRQFRDRSSPNRPSDERLRAERPFYNSWYGSNFGHFAPSWRYDGAGHRWNSWGPANGQRLLRQ